MGLRDLFRPKWRHSDWSVRKAAVEEMDPAEQALLAEIAESDTDLDVRGAAVAKLEDQEVLARVALNDENESVRQNAASKLEDQAALAEFAKGHEDTEVLWAALEKLTDQDELLGVAKDAKESSLRAGAVGRLEDPALVAEFAVRDEDEWVRRAAVRRLGELGGASAVEALCKALVDPEDHVTEEAAEALGKLGDPRAIEPLIGALDKHYLANVGAALESFGEEAVPPMIKALASSPKGHIPGWLISILDDIDETWTSSGPGIDALTVTLTAEDPHARVKAAEALAEVGDERVLEPLLAALADPHTITIAAQGLKEIGGPRVEEALAGVAVELGAAEDEEVDQILSDFGESLWAPGYPLNAAAFNNEVDVLVSLGRLRELRDEGNTAARQALSRVQEEVSACLCGARLERILLLHRGESRLAFAKSLRDMLEEDETEE